MAVTIVAQHKRFSTANAKVVGVPGYTKMRIYSWEMLYISEPGDSEEMEMEPFYVTEPILIVGYRNRVSVDQNAVDADALSNGRLRIDAEGDHFELGETEAIRRRATGGDPTAGYVAVEAAVVIDTQYIPITPYLPLDDGAKITPHMRLQNNHSSKNADHYMEFDLYVLEKT